MKLIFSILFISSLLGSLVSYPLYFYMLNKFREIIKSENFDAWEKIREGKYVEIQAAYRALQLSKNGTLGDIPLSNQALHLRRVTVYSLYFGIFFFMILLFVGLADSVIVGKY